MDMQDRDDWLALRINTMRTGWRGCVRIRFADQPDGDMPVIGTVVGEPSIERKLERGGATDATDATVTLCINYHAGSFGPVSKHSCIAVRASEVVDMQPM